MVDIVFHSTYPAELILALRADHVVAATLFLLHDHSTLRAVCHRLLVFVLSEELLHGVVQLSFTVFLSMVGETTFHANLVVTMLTLAMVDVPSSKNTVCSLLDMHREGSVHLVIFKLSG